MRGSETTLPGFRERAAEKFAAGQDWTLKLSMCPKVTRSREALHTDPEHTALIATGGWIVPTSGTFIPMSRELWSCYQRTTEIQPAATRLCAEFEQRMMAALGRYWIPLCISLVNMPTF